jgi:hypothetical protein
MIEFSALHRYPVTPSILDELPAIRKLSRRAAGDQYREVGIAEVIRDSTLALFPNNGQLGNNRPISGRRTVQNLWLRQNQSCPMYESASLRWELR